MRTSFAAAALTAVLFAAGCGSSDDPPPTTVFVQATVDELGSLRVNGVPFRTRGAVVRYVDDGTTLTLGDAATGLPFLPGTVVAVRGALAADRRSGTAEEVIVRSVLRAPLQGRGESSLAVAGADVLVDSRTTILGASDAPTTLAALPAGERVEVHGWAEAGNRVRATLVRVLPGTPSIAVNGWSLAAPVNGEFDLSLLLGGAPILRVDASAASVSLPLPANALVRVGGSGITAGGPPRLAATSVNVVAQLLPIGEDRVVVEGLVLSGGAAEFTVGDLRARTSADTIYDGVPAGAVGAALIGPGVRLVAEGVRDGGTVLAERVRFVDVVRLAGRIDPGSLAISNPASAVSFTIGGEIAVADASTSVTSGDTSLTLQQLVELHAAEPAGLAIALVGYRRADDALQAQRIELTGG